MIIDSDNKVVDYIDATFQPHRWNLQAMAQTRQQEHLHKCAIKLSTKHSQSVYIFPNVKEILAWGRRHVLSLSDSNQNWTHNDVVRKRTLNHLTETGQMIELFIECRFTLKLVRYMIITYSHIRRAVKYSQHSSVPPHEKALSEAGYNAKLKFNPNKKRNMTCSIHHALKIW